MSALCQKRTFVTSFDQIIGKGEYLCRYRQANRLRSREIDDKLELSWRLDRQVSRLLALEYQINIGCRTPD